MHPFLPYSSLCLLFVFAVSVATLVIVSILLARDSAHVAVVQSLASALADTPAVVADWQTPERNTILACSLLALAIVHEDDQLNGTQIGPARTARALAISHIALADAVGASTGIYRPYTDTPLPNISTGSSNGLSTSLNTDSLMRAAAVRATVDTLLAIYGTAQQQQQTLRANASRLLAAIPDSAAKLAGIKIGADAARRILAARADDGSDHTEPPASKYESNLPGRWRRDPISKNAVALGGLWGSLVQPFVLESARQFACAPPPSIDSMQYVIEYDAAVALGSDGTTTPTVRDATQTQIANENWSPHSLFLATHTNCADCNATTLSRTLAIVGIVLADTSLAAFKSLYDLLRERPVTAIRNGVRDGNDATAGFPQFTPYGATPPYPSMPNIDVSLASAWADVMRQLRNTNATQQQQQADVTGVYSGTNWYSDATNAAIQAKQIAQYIAARVYQPIE